VNNKLLFSIIVVGLWLIILPVSIGIDDFLFPLSALLLFYPQIIVIMAVAFLGGFFLRKTQPRKVSLIYCLIISGVIGVNTIGNFWTFTDPGLFHMETQIIMLIGIYASLFTLGSLYAGMLVREQLIKRGM